MTSFVPGWMTDTPIAAVMADSTTTSSARMTNSVAGCGRMFPARSMNPRKRFRKESFARDSSRNSVPTDAMVLPLLAAPLSGGMD